VEVCSRLSDHTHGSCGSQNGSTAHVERRGIRGPLIVVSNVQQRRVQELVYTSPKYVGHRPREQSTGTSSVGITWHVSSDLNLLASRCTTSLEVRCGVTLPDRAVRISVLVVLHTSSYTAIYLGLFYCRIPLPSLSIRSLSCLVQQIFATVYAFLAVTTGAFHGNIQ